MQRSLQILHMSMSAVICYISYNNTYIKYVYSILILYRYVTYIMYIIAHFMIHHNLLCIIQITLTLFIRYACHSDDIIPHGNLENVSHSVTKQRYYILRKLYQIHNLPNYFNISMSCDLHHVHYYVLTLFHVLQLNMNQYVLNKH